MIKEEIKIIALIEKIGLDRMVISNFRIRSLNRTKLTHHDNVTFDIGDAHGYLLEDGTCFTHLKINDNKLFGSLIAGTHRTRSVKRDYSKMDITIGNSKTGNLQNLSVAEYKARIRTIFSYIYEEYGLLIDTSPTTISTLEINCTFEIDTCFSEYHRPLRLLMFLLPGYYKKIIEVSKKDTLSLSLESETFYRGNSSMQIKIYDKKRQLQDTQGYRYDGNILRIEFVLKTAQKIKEVFGSNSLCNLSDEIVNEYYIHQFRKLFENKYQKWKKDNGKQLRQKILEHKKENPIYWQRTLLNELRNYEQTKQIPILLEISDLLVQVKSLDTTGHYKRIEKSILNKCHDDDVYLQNDAQKITEIISKVENIYKNYVTLSTTATLPSTPCGDKEMC